MAEQTREPMKSMKWTVLALCAVMLLVVQAEVAPDEDLRFMEELVEEAPVAEQQKEAPSQDKKEEPKQDKKEEPKQDKKEAPNQDKKEEPKQEQKDAAQSTGDSGTAARLDKIEADLAGLSKKWGEGGEFHDALNQVKKEASDTKEVKQEAKEGKEEEKKGEKKMEQVKQDGEAVKKEASEAKQEIEKVEQEEKKVEEQVKDVASGETELKNFVEQKMKELEDKIQQGGASGPKSAEVKAEEESASKAEQALETDLSSADKLASEAEAIADVDTAAQVEAALKKGAPAAEIKKIRTDMLKQLEHLGEQAATAAKQVDSVLKEGAKKSAAFMELTESAVQDTHNLQARLHKLLGRKHAQQAMLKMKM